MSRSWRWYWLLFLKCKQELEKVTSSNEKSSGVTFFCCVERPLTHALSKVRFFRFDHIFNKSSENHALHGIIYWKRADND